VASVSRDSGRAATDRLFGRAAHCSHGHAGVSARPLVQLTNVYSRQRASAGADLTQSHRPCQTGLQWPLTIGCRFIVFSVREEPRECPAMPRALANKLQGMGTRG
jgi:hypothetical protein